MFDYIKLNQGLPFFEPKKRHAILVNNYGYSGYSRHELHTRGNLRIYDMESILSGKVTFGDGSENYGFWPMVLSDCFGKIMRSYKEHRRDLKYEPVIKIFPDENVPVRLSDSAKKLSTIASKDSLTFVYLMSHGNDGSISLGNLDVKYKDILDLFDDVLGKKTILITACHSGSLIRELCTREKREDYVLITSSRSNEKATNCGDDDVDRLIWDVIHDRKKLSDIDFTSGLMSGLFKDQTPQIFGYFDVQL